jgi:hypothetical protein
MFLTLDSEIVEEKPHGAPESASTVKAEQPTLQETLRFDDSKL